MTSKRRFYVVAKLSNGVMFVRKGGAIGFGKYLWPTFQKAFNAGSVCGYDFEVVEVGYSLDRFPDNLLTSPSKIYVGIYTGE